ncbi:hypothetical protein J2X14_000629 [Pantoea alhagi]|uniref:HNH endonuclease signature motif containing protein n=1 Tax=Mixta sp. BE291 TaxID=3158787 RepID=UPI00285CB99D|nr:hypothetical protein [Pantoea alhagi]
MSFSLPGTDLYYLPRDDLAPERYEQITRPVFAWPRIDNEYVFDDRPSLNFQLINMYRRDVYGYTHQWPPHGPREREKLKEMIYCGDVVMLEKFNFSPGDLFYIDNHGELICRDRLAFKFDGAQRIIRAYKHAVARRDYSQRGGKPRPTVMPSQRIRKKQPSALSIIDSKMAGRLLAAGALYHQHPEMFAETARKLGDKAAQGFEQVLNEQTAGTLVAFSSLLMLGRASASGRPSAINPDEMKHYLGKVKGRTKLLHNIEAIELDYLRRDRAELATMRNQFKAIKRKFLKEAADHSDVRQRLSIKDREIMSRGKNPEGWDVHHKIPLDDTGTNDFSNLVLIRRHDEHKILTNAQATVINNMQPGESRKIIWVIPTGIIYP